MRERRPGGRAHSPVPLIFLSLLLLFLLLVFALFRNEPPPTADDARNTVLIGA